MLRSNFTIITDEIPRKISAFISFDGEKNQPHVLGYADDCFVSLGSSRYCGTGTTLY